MVQPDLSFTIITDLVISGTLAQRGVRRTAVEAVEEPGAASVQYRALAA